MIETESFLLFFFFQRSKSMVVLFRQWKLCKWWRKNLLWTNGDQKSIQSERERETDSKGCDHEACGVMQANLLPLSVGQTLIHPSRELELLARSGPAVLSSICQIRFAGCWRPPCLLLSHDCTLFLCASRRLLISAATFCPNLFWLPCVFLPNFEWISFNSN